MTEVEEKKKRVPKPPIEAKDALGQDLRLDSVVVAPYTTSTLIIGRVAKISPKTVKVRRLGSSATRWLLQKKHEEVVVIGDNPATTMYVIQHDVGH